MIEEAVYELLKGDAGIAGIVGSRIYPGHLPQDPTLPALSFFRVSEAPGELHHTGAVKVFEPRFQISSWALDPLTAKRLAQAVRDLFHGYSGTVAGEKIISAQFAGEQEFSDPSSSEYHIPVEVVFRHEAV